MTKLVSLYIFQLKPLNLLMMLSKDFLYFVCINETEAPNHQLLAQCRRASKKQYASNSMEFVGPLTRHAPVKSPVFMNSQGIMGLKDI